MTVSQDKGLSSRNARSTQKSIYAKFVWAGLTDILWLKVLLTDLIWEKNIICWLKKYGLEAKHAQTKQETTASTWTWTCKWQEKWTHLPGKVQRTTWRSFPNWRKGVSSRPTNQLMTSNKFSHTVSKGFGGFVTVVSSIFWGQVFEN